MKKIFNYHVIALFVGFFLMMVVPSQAVAQIWYGDVNGDGRVTVDDVTALIDGLLVGDTIGTMPQEKSYLSSKDFGAVGDGVTDDTDALERLFESAFNAKKAVFFEPGVYMIRRSLMLRTGMEVYGSEATIKKFTAVTTRLAESAAKGQTYIDVLSTDGFRVGDQICIIDPLGANWCTYGIITTIEENRINFYNIISEKQPLFPGCIKAYPSGYSVTTSIALLRSWTALYECDGVYIHDLTLDGNRRSYEPLSWANSCIHLDSYCSGGGYTGNSGIEYRTVQRNLMARNLVIMNSPHDGISDQGEGGLIVADCVIQNSAMHGIHLGTWYDNALIYNNTMTGNGSNGAGVFFCQDVNNVIVDKNQITGFNHGCSDEEFGTCGKYITIRNNTFNNITGYVFDFMKASANKRGGGLQISNNVVTGLKAPLFSGQYIDNLILTDNEVKNVTTAPTRFVRITESNNAIVAGNKMPADVTVSTPVVSTNTTNLIDVSNTWNNSIDPTAEFPN